MPSSGQHPAGVFGYPRNFLKNRFVYVVISERANGLVVGLNLAPHRQCNFQCVYCEVDRQIPSADTELDVEVMAEEMERTMAFIQEGGVRSMECYSHLPPELLRLRFIALSGDGEPTMCRCFGEAVQSVVRLRAMGTHPFFKLVLITNATGLDAPAVQQGLKFFTKQDEIWVKLDAGTQEYMDRINRPGPTIHQVTNNILALGRQRPVIIQSLFPAVAGGQPSMKEIAAYADRLKQLREQGAIISLVQIYSSGRPSANAKCGHLPLRTLSRIAHYVRDATGLPVEVF